MNPNSVPASLSQQSGSPSIPIRTPVRLPEISNVEVKGVRTPSQSSPPSSTPKVDIRPSARSLLSPFVERSQPLQLNPSKPRSLQTPYLRLQSSPTGSASNITPNNVPRSPRRALAKTPHLHEKRKRQIVLSQATIPTALGAGPSSKPSNGNENHENIFISGEVRPRARSRGNTTSDLSARGSPRAGGKMDSQSVSSSPPLVSGVHTPDESPFSTPSMPPSRSRLWAIGNAEGISDTWEDTSSAGEDEYESIVDIALCSSQRSLSQTALRRWSSDNQSQGRSVSRQSPSKASKKEPMNEEPLSKDSPTPFGTDTAETTPSHSPCTSTHEIPVLSSSSTSIFPPPEIKHGNTPLVGLK